MRVYLSLAFALLPILATTASAADLVLYPPEIPLSGPQARQQLLVLARDNGLLIGDRTEKADFTSSNPNVAAVENGEVRAIGDGEAIITARVGSQSATAAVRVTRTKEAFAWSFRNHIVPIMTKVGCNSGACHGALAGKGGMKLSLRGYDPESDHFVLTRQAAARRVDRQEPAKSLRLQKPTRRVPHGGGKR